LVDLFECIMVHGLTNPKFYFYVREKFILHAEPSKERPAVLLFANRDSNMSIVALEH